MAKKSSGTKKGSSHVGKSKVIKSGKMPNCDPSKGPMPKAC